MKNDQDGSAQEASPALRTQREIKFRIWRDGMMYRKNVMSWEGLGDYLVGVDWAVAMQWTGLKDKNDREIYEGDILYFDLQDAFGSDHFHTAEVVMGGAAFGCVLKYRNGQEGWIGLNEIKQDDDEIEVLGNIYENPDLLRREAHGGARSAEPEQDPSPPVTPTFPKEGQP